MNTDAINEIRKAAEAAIKGPYNISDSYPVFVNSEGVKWQHSDPDVDEEVDSFVANVGSNVEQAEYFASLDPATVLELCRLAEIGLASNGESGVQRGHNLPEPLTDAMADGFFEGGEDAEFSARIEAAEELLADLGETK